MYYFFIFYYFSQLRILLFCFVIFCSILPYSIPFLLSFSILLHFVLFVVHLWYMCGTLYVLMKQQIIISPTNSKAVEFLKSIKDKKTQMQKHFAQPGSKLPSLKVKFTATPTT